MGSLYLIATPIGNLEDLGFRALRLLREVKLVAAEDTRHTGRLLNHYGIDTPQISYHEHNKLTRLDAILSVLEDGDVALVSDAGTPALSDPGYKLVQAAIERGITIVPIPGPCAPIAALVASGLPTDAFVYQGYLPRRAKERRQLLQNMAEESRTLIFFESPRRLKAALTDIQAILGNRSLSIARELSKLHEEIWRGTVEQAIFHFEHVRGEITLVVAGSPQEPTYRWSQAQVRNQVAQLVEQGIPHSQAVKQIAQVSGWRRRQIYELTKD